MRPGNTAASFEKMLQRRQTVGKTVSNLTGPKFELKTSRSRDEPLPFNQLAGAGKPFTSNYIRFALLFYEKKNAIVLFFPISYKYFCSL